MKFFQTMNNLFSLGIILLGFEIVKADIVQKFIDEGIVPDVLDKAPSDLLKISINSKYLEPGDKITPLESDNKPILNLNLDPNSIYAMVMTDPDAPSRQDTSWAEFLHWTVVNIPGNEFTNGETLVEYMRVCPPLGTGFHRYVFVLYKQPEKIKFEETPVSASSLEGRPNFSLKKFAQKYNFGDPIAGNYFMSEFDDTVTAYLAKFGINL